MTTPKPTISIPADLLPQDGRFGCGPSKVRPEQVQSLAALGRTYLGTSHRQKTVKDVVGRLRTGLRELFTLPDGYEVVLGNGGSTAFWEVATFCLVELQRLSHDRSEIVTRAVQPVLWLLIFGETFNRLHAIPTGKVPYLDFLAPGIIAQSGMFVAIFYGIQIIWERDAGILTKLLVTPTPRSALILGKAFAAGIRSMLQVVVVLLLSIVLGVALTTDPIRILGAFAIVVMGSAFFACLSMTIAGVVLRRDRLMGIAA